MWPALSAAANFKQLFLYVVSAHIIERTLDIAVGVDNFHRDVVVDKIALVDVLKLSNGVFVAWK